MFFLSSQFLEFRIEIDYGLLYLVGLAGHESRANGVMVPESQPLQFFHGDKVDLGDLLFYSLTA